MSSDALPIFNAAMNLPNEARAELAAQLIASLDKSFPPAPRTGDWDDVLRERSAAMNHGDAQMVDGADAIAQLRAVVDRARRST